MTAVSTDKRFKYENKFRRQMVHTLSGTETKVMIYIIDRTLGWMKDTETISYREFLEGNANNFGVGVHKTPAHKAVKSLEEKNIIDVISSSKKYGTKIKINMDWTYEDYLDRYREE
jgi:hypothetical protein